mgnify:CR=1 FL=1
MPRDCDHKCQACGVPGMREFLEWRQVPVHQNFHIPTLEQALSCTRGDIVLAICESCKFISNLAFSTELLQYQPGHDASQDHSAYFSNYLKNLVEGLIERHGLRDKSIVEIGCGQGASARHGGGIEMDARFEQATEIHPWLQYHRDFQEQE